MQHRPSLLSALGASLALSLGSAGCIDQLDQPDDEYSDVESDLTGAWSVESVPTTALLHGVYAAGADDVFAVGDGGTILRRKGGAWLPMVSGTTANLRTVHGTSSSNVWAVGGGAVLHFDGVAWLPAALSASPSSVWTSGNDVWMSGLNTVWRSTNGGASFTQSSASGNLYAISGTSGNDVWITGENSNVRHYVNGTGSTVSTGAGTATNFAVLAVSTTDVWTSDYMSTKETMHLVKGKWVAAKATASIFQGMYATSATDVWGVGGSKIGRWNGTAWTTSTPFGTSASLWAVSGSAGHVFAVGSNGLVAHYAY